MRDIEHWCTSLQVADFPGGIGYEPEGRQFDSVRAHHKINNTGY